MKKKKIDDTLIITVQTAICLVKKKIKTMRNEKQNNNARCEHVLLLLSSLNSRSTAFTTRKHINTNMRREFDASLLHSPAVTWFGVVTHKHILHTLIRCNKNTVCVRSSATRSHFQSISYPMIRNFILFIASVMQFSSVKWIIIRYRLYYPLLSLDMFSCIKCNINCCEIWCAQMQRLAIKATANVE